MKSFGDTNIGYQRKRNEDAYWIDEERNLFIVCDGMGGHRGGNVASQMAVDIVSQHFTVEHLADVKVALREAINLANNKIREAGLQDEELRDMGTTITAAVIDQEKIIVAHVGDSSLYIIHEQQIRKLTNDHTLAEQMFMNGSLKKEDMRSNAFHHILTKALGSDTGVKPDIFEDKVQAGDWLMLCTDGLSNLVEMEEIPPILCKQHEPQRAVQELIDLALSRGGHDNITVVLSRI